VSDNDPLTIDVLEESVETDVSENDPLTIDVLEESVETDVSENDPLTIDVLPIEIVELVELVEVVVQVAVWPCLNGWPSSAVHGLPAGPRLAPAVPVRVSA
jgi:hypothetical protein